MEQSAFWRERRDGTFEDCPGNLEVRACTNDNDWPYELTTVNEDGEDIGISLSMVDSIRLYHKMSLQFGPMFS